MNAVNGVKLHKSGGECGEKNLYLLVAVKLHNFTAEFIAVNTQIHRLEKSVRIMQDKR